MIRDLLGSPYKTYQTKKQPFNIDTILLANFATPTADMKTIIDLGTGAGALSLYMAYKTKCHIIGVELQEILYFEALKNVELNNLKDTITLLNEDIINLPTKFQDIDMIITNPPFFKVENNSKINESNYRAIARHEIHIDLKKIIAVSNKLLKTGGKLYLVHRPNRLIELINECENNRLKIKSIRFVYSYIHSEANHVLVEARKDGNDGLQVLPPLILYKDKDVLTDEMKKIYQNIKYKQGD